MAQLIVGLTPALARALARGDRTTDVELLHDVTAQAQVELRPQTARSLDALDAEPGTRRRRRVRGDGVVLRRDRRR